MLIRSERTVRRWIADDKLPAHRVGRTVRIRQSDVDRLADQLVAASPPPPEIVPIPASLRKQLFSAREVADLLDAAEETVTRWLEHGMLPGFRGPDGGWIVRRVDLTPWARPLLKSDALDALERSPGDSGVASVQDLLAMAGFFSSRIAAQDFERRARMQLLFHYIYIRRYGARCNSRDWLAPAQPSHRHERPVRVGALEAELLHHRRDAARRVRHRCHARTHGEDQRASARPLSPYLRLSLRHVGLGRSSWVWERLCTCTHVGSVRRSARRRLPGLRPGAPPNKLQNGVRRPRGDRRLPGAGAIPLRPRALKRSPVQMAGDQ